MVERGGEKFSGYNKPKRTPSHGKKSHAVLAKVGDKVKLTPQVLQGPPREEHQQGQDVSGLLGQQGQVVGYFLWSFQ